MSLISTRNRIYYQSQNRQLNPVRRRSPDPLAHINPDKAKELGISDGDWIWIETELSRVKFRCQYFEGMLPNMVAAEFGWWFPEDPAEEPSLHGLWKSNLNAILPDGPESCDAITGAWVLKGARCKVYKDTD
jgi:anaerobic selenocysteine-containing dehydrogenase